MLGTRPSIAADLEWIGQIGPPDGRGVALAPGFTSRLIAQSSAPPVGLDGLPWHTSPDGAATFPRADGGWVLVSNAELPLVGGASALHFDPSGEPTSLRRVLTNTSINCAGGPTPWGTWLSCEEHEDGRVWECDPLGTADDARPRPALGRFTHEAAAVDPEGGIVYLTEDRSDGLLYRFRPDEPGTLTAGILEAARVRADGSVDWLAVPSPATGSGEDPLRRRVPEATAFRRGEGAWLADGTLWFATTGDATLWRFEIAENLLTIAHRGSDPGSPLQGPDNVVVSPSGHVMVAEDGGNLELVVVTATGDARPLLRFEGPLHEGSEVTGPCFSPDGTRLYVSSQRGGPSGSGMTIEVTGPFPSPKRADPAPVRDRTSTSTAERSAANTTLTTAASDGGGYPVVLVGTTAAIAVAAAGAAAVAIRRRR